MPHSQPMFSVYQAKEEICASCTPNCAVAGGGRFKGCIAGMFLKYLLNHSLGRLNDDESEEERDVTQISFGASRIPHCILRRNVLCGGLESELGSCFYLD